MGCGARKFERPFIGAWPWDGLPDEAELWVAGGPRTLRRTSWVSGGPGVVAEYREAVARNSLHLKVREDWTYRADHVDRVNPDGDAALAPVAHFLQDTDLGCAIAAGAKVAAGILVLAAIIGAVSKA
ncbi:MAG: hypothetical protein L0216_00030 [Planctomycetales bacterium]|nr:hypothetical protein [Planctomycetales bacterium]